jgi:predicted transcriptional regulator
VAKPFYFDPYGSGLEIFLGPTEAALMELAWKHGELSVKKALTFLGEDKRAYTTVMTVLARLAEKEILIREKDGRNYLYRPAMDREQFIKSRVAIVRDCLKKNFPAKS